MIDLATLLTRKLVFARATFGPGIRLERLTNHIHAELEECAEALEQGDKQAYVEECVDVVTLALEMLLRATLDRYKCNNTEAGRRAEYEILAAQHKIEGRIWPDWRTLEDDQPIFHVKGGGE